MPLILRSVKGSNLTPNEADGNFVYLDGRITTEIANITAGVGIDSITISGAVLTFHMSDGSLETVTLPASLYTWQPKGEWQPTTAYAVNDTVAYFGSLYLVIFAHTSAASFDPAANDGSGHYFYALILPSTNVWGQTITSATYTTLATDANTYMRFTSSTGCVITIDEAISYPAWCEMRFRDECELAITAPTGGLIIEIVTPGSINPVRGYLNQSAAQGATIGVKQVADTGSWDIFGLLAAEGTFT